MNTDKTGNKEMKAFALSVFICVHLWPSIFVGVARQPPGAHPAHQCPAGHGARASHHGKSGLFPPVFRVQAASDEEKECPYGKLDPPFRCLHQHTSRTAVSSLFPRRSGATIAPPEPLGR